jgi:maltose alpha-D-glucosyltransferase/alpha-amylase
MWMAKKPRNAADRRPALVQGCDHLPAAHQVVLRRQWRWHRRFPGLIQKLDYIAALGVNAIWLLPFFPSPRRDDGYDIADYGASSRLRHDGRFPQGSSTPPMIAGMRVIIELVINHTSDQHPWFQRARHAPKGSRARLLRLVRQRPEIPEHPDHLSRYREVQLDLGPGGRRLLTGTASTRTSRTSISTIRGDEGCWQVMRFWLETGIDGFVWTRSPICRARGHQQREPAGNPRVLKKIRAELDATHPGGCCWPRPISGRRTRANISATATNATWLSFPADAAHVHGNRQGRPFPDHRHHAPDPGHSDNCQWAIFLRNHDELTLEMVTDAERDYLWSTYASDKRARINLGIRRRLAPLMERDRRRIELMNALLLSMPARRRSITATRSAWATTSISATATACARRCNGPRPQRRLSRAPIPARLVLPPVADPSTVLRLVNVEAQVADAHSLLNWTRRMLAWPSGRADHRRLYP